MIILNGNFKGTKYDLPSRRCLDNFKAAEGIDVSVYSCFKVGPGL